MDYAWPDRLHCTCCQDKRQYAACDVTGPRGLEKSTYLGRSLTRYLPTNLDT